MIRAFLMSLVMLVPCTGIAAAEDAPVAFANAEALCDVEVPPGATVETLFFLQFTGLGRARAPRYACVVLPGGHDPADTDRRAVFVLHGGNHSARDLMALHKEITREADDRGYLAIFAQGWPVADCPGTPCDTNKWEGMVGHDGALVDRGALNLTYVKQLIDRARAQYDIAPDAIYLAGFSGGAKTIFRLFAADTAADPFPFAPRAAATSAGIVLQFLSEDPALGQQADLGLGVVEGVINFARGGVPTPLMMMQYEFDGRVPLSGGLTQPRAAEQDGVGGGLVAPGADRLLRAGLHLSVGMARAMNDAFETGQAPLEIMAGVTADVPVGLTLFEGEAPVYRVIAEDAKHQWPPFYTAMVFNFFDLVGAE